MNMLKPLAVAVSLFAGITATHASPYDAMGGLMSLEAITKANAATVVSVSTNEAYTLSFDNDVAAVQQRIRNNPYLARTVANQGYTIDQVVGIAGNQTDLTIYAL